MVGLTYKVRNVPTNNTMTTASNIALLNAAVRAASEHLASLALKRDEAVRTACNLHEGHPALPAAITAVLLAKIALRDARAKYTAALNAAANAAK